MNRPSKDETTKTSKFGECSVKLTRVRFEEPRETRLLRSATKPVDNVQNSENVQNVQVIPGKRTRRAISTPANEVQSDQSRPKRRNVSKAKDKNAAKCVEEIDESIIIALNCKLTNEMLILKKSLLQKNEDFIGMQKQYYEKNIECIALKSEIGDLKKEVEGLNKVIENLKAERYCADLIQFEEESNLQCNDGAKDADLMTNDPMENQSNELNGTQKKSMQIGDTEVVRAENPTVKAANEEDDKGVDLMTNDFKETKTNELNGAQEKSIQIDDTEVVGTEDSTARAVDKGSHDGSSKWTPID